MVKLNFPFLYNIVIFTQEFVKFDENSCKKEVGI